MRERIPLNGQWDWYIPGGEKKKIKVPSSYICVGEANFEKSFYIDLIRGKRVFLRFEGIAYEGHVYVNGSYVGSMLPYSRYDFDITEYILQGENRIKVNIKDINATYGPTDGWENYGGIIWDVYLEVRNNVYISDYQILTDFTDNYRKARCHLKVWSYSYRSETFKGTLSTTLTYNDVEFARISKDIDVTPKEGYFKLEFDILNPFLWSPEFPNLYNLEIELRDDIGVLDKVSQKIGFREFIKKGTHFYLNGQKIILNGVCRHHMWGNQGYTLTLEQMEKDMRMIKDIGVNYVRLVHYPHPKEIIEIADKLGLMVSEEPGLWWSDLTNPVIVNSALEVLRRTILRDRNNPSVIFWLIFNECIFAGDYIKRARNLCKELDPSRMVSAANCMNPEWTKKVFTEEDLDFYTFHPYGYSPEDSYAHDHFATIQRGYGSQKPFTSFKEILEILNDKPVVFTEWGGKHASENLRVIKNLWRAILKFFNNESPNPTLAGASYWCWNEYFEFSFPKWPPEGTEGIPAKRLVDIWRNKTINYFVISELFSQLRYPVKGVSRIEFADLFLNIGQYNLEPIDLGSLINTPEQEILWKLMIEKEIMENKGSKRKDTFVGPIIPEEIHYVGNIPVNISKGRPLMLSKSTRQINIKINKQCSKVFFFGHVALPAAYPVKGEKGKEVARYILLYQDGTKDIITLRNGIEVTTANIIWGPSRLNPLAPNVYQALRLIVDPIFEVYLVNCFILKANDSKVLSDVYFELSDDYYIPLLYGITLGLRKWD